MLLRTLLKSSRAYVHFFVALRTINWGGVVQQIITRFRRAPGKWSIKIFLSLTCTLHSQNTAFIYFWFLQSFRSWKRRRAWCECKKAKDPNLESAAKFVKALFDSMRTDLMWWFHTMVLCFNTFTLENVACFLWVCRFGGENVIYLYVQLRDSNAMTQISRNVNDHWGLWNHEGLPFGSTHFGMMNCSGLGPYTHCTFTHYRQENGAPISFRTPVLCGNNSFSRCVNRTIELQVQKP